MPNNSNKPVPKDLALYNKVKRDVYARMPTHSAYRSGHLVKAYKYAFSKKYGSSANPYTTTTSSNTKGNKKPSKTGLSRWFKEKWRNQRGEVGYKRDGDIYRPTVKITSKTPKTFKELSKKQISSAMSQKRRGQRASF